MVELTEKLQSWCISSGVSVSGNPARSLLVHLSWRGPSTQDGRPLALPARSLCVVTEQLPNVKQFFLRLHLRDDVNVESP